MWGWTRRSSPGPLPDSCQGFLNTSRRQRGPWRSDRREKRVSALPLTQVFPQKLSSPDGEEHRPRLPPLSQHAYTPLLPIHLLRTNPCRLAQPAAAGGQEFYQRLVPDVPAALPQLAQFRLCQRAASRRPVHAPAPDPPHGAFPDHVLQLQPCEKAPQRVGVGDDAPVLQPSLRQSGQIPPDIVGGDLLRRPVYIPRKRPQHKAIVFQRFGGQAVDPLRRQE